MKNLNLKIFMIIHPSDVTLNVKNTNMTNLMYTAYITHPDYNFDYPALRRRLRINQCEKFFIYDIKLLNEKSESFLLTTDYLSFSPISSSNLYYLLHECNLKVFLKKKKLMKFCIPKTKSLKTNLCIETLFWFLIIPTDLRFAQFITCLEGMSKTTVFDSFNNYDKLASQPLWDIHNRFKTLDDFINLKTFYEKLEEWLQFKLQKTRENIYYDLKKMKF